MDVPMRVIQCCECFVAFAMTTELYEKRLKDHKSFYCPVGHGQHFVGKSDEEKLKEQLKQKEKLLEDKTKLLAEAQAAGRRLQDARIDMVDAFLKEQFKKSPNGVLLKTIAPQLGMKTGELYSFLSVSATGIELSRSGKGWMVSKQKDK